MASRLSFIQIQCSSCPKKFSKPCHRIPFSLPLTLSSHSKYGSAKSISTYRAGQSAIEAVKEELVENPTSESTENGRKTPSTSKLVLVVGGTGGVGKINLCFLCCCTLDVVKKIVV